MQFLLAAMIDELEAPIDAEPNDRRGEYAIIKRHVFDEAHRRGRHAGRRREQRNDGAAGRIAADQQPCQQIKQNDHAAADRRGEQHGIVLQHRLELLRRRRLQHHALGKARRDGQPVGDRHRPCGAEYDAAGLLLDDCCVLAGRTLRAGVERGLLELDLIRQIDPRLRDLDRKRPAVAGGVPVKLVVTVEEADLPRGAVADDIFMQAGVDAPAGAADPHAHAVRHLLGGELLDGAVARHRLDIETDLDPRAVGAPIGGGKVAQDAAIDLAAFGPDLNGLGHQQIAIALHVNVADETRDALLGRGGQKRRNKDKECKKYSIHDDFCSGKTTVGLITDPASAWKKSSS